MYDYFDTKDYWFNNERFTVTVSVDNNDCIHIEVVGQQSLFTNVHWKEIASLQNRLDALSIPQAIADMIISQTTLLKLLLFAGLR